MKRRRVHVLCVLEEKEGYVLCVHEEQEGPCFMCS